MIRADFPHIQLLAQNDNLGFAKANNVGLAHCSGQYICLINSDVVVSRGCIQTMVEYLKMHPRIGMLGPRMRLKDGTIGKSCMGFPTVWNWFCRASALDVLFHNTKFFCGYLRSDFQYDRIQDVDVLTGWFWVVRRQALDEVGPLDKRYFFYGDDIDWSKRFHDAGWKVVFYPYAEAIHYCGSSSARAPIRFYIEMRRANLQYCQKFHGVPSKAGFWLMLWLQEVLRVVGYGTLYLLTSSRREEARHKIKRSVRCVFWLMGLSSINSAEKA